MTQQDAAITIRKGVLSDLVTIAAFNMAMAKETEDLDLPEATAHAGVLAVLEGKTHAAYYLLEQSGEVVAQLMITLEWSDWRASDIWWIQSVYVRPDCRRRGHFRALYAHVREECLRAGACGLRLYADTGNERAHAAYEGLGMSSHYKVFEDMFTQY